jgi:hypothetical protein
MVHTTPTKVLLTTTLRPLVGQLSGSLAQGVRLLDRARSQGSNLCQTQVIGLGVPLLEHFPLDLVS